MSAVEMFIESLNDLSGEEQKEFVRPFLSLGGIDRKDLKLALKDEIRGNFPKKDDYQRALEKFAGNVERRQMKNWKSLGYK